MADSSAAAKGKLGQALEALDKAYGKVHSEPEEPPLDHAVYLLLREHWDYRKAGRALRLLQKEYVDWNEIRVSTAGELHTLLIPLGDKDVDVKIEKIKTLLDNLYRDRNCVHLNFLEGMDPERAHRFLSRLGVLNAGQVAILMHTLAGPEEWEVPSDSLRVLTRMGLLPRVYSAASGRKNILKLVDPGDLITLQSHLAQHAEDICLSRSPRCGECAIVSQCAFKRKVGVVAKG